MFLLHSHSLPLFRASSAAVRPHIRRFVASIAHTSSVITPHPPTLAPMLLNPSSLVDISPLLASYRRDDRYYPDGTPRSTSDLQRRSSNFNNDHHHDGTPRSTSDLQRRSSNFNNDHHHDDDDDDENDPKKKKSSAGGKLAGAAAAASILMGKTKYIFAGLKIAKFGPLASMVLTSFTYSFFFGWPYSVGMVGLIFVHELGHLFVMRHYKIPFSPMTFIPFMGAVISMKDHPQDAYQDAMIAFGGPVLGSAGAAVLGTVGAATDSQLCFALADFGYMVNLFNLMPIGSMDGGRIGGAIHPGLQVMGIGAGGFMVYNGFIANPLIYLILGAGTYSTARRVLGYHDYHESYYKIGGEKKAAITVGYIGLIGALLVAMKKNNERRKTPKQLQAMKEGRYVGDGGVTDGAVYDDFFDEGFDDDDTEWRG